MPRPNRTASTTAFERLAVLLSTPVSAASLAVFRVAVGVVMALEAYSLCVPNPAAISSGLSPLENYYTGSHIVLHFPFTAFAWLPMAGKTGIHVVVGLMAASGLAVALGLFYRLSSALLFLTWGYLFAVESTRTYWQSHYYLELLLTFLLVWLPAHAGYSLDALRRRRGGDGDPRPTIPFWPVFLLRGQLLIAYFYAGVAKLTEDWLLDAMPVRFFLNEPGVLDPFRKLLPAAVFPAFQGLVESAPFAFFLCYVGLVFDLAIGALFLFRRTRILSMALMVVFHATNHFLIFDDIGWFPLVGVLTSLIFLDADWPLRLGAWIARPVFRKPDWGWFWKGFLLLPGIGGALGWKLEPSPAPSRPTPPVTGKPVLIGVLGWLLFQTLTPLRHHLIPGDGRFTYEGMSLSWRLKAEVRRAYSPQWVVDDPEVLRKDAAGRSEVDWSRWKGEKVLYRELSPGRIDWRSLPEILVIVEPYVGERILFNPFPSGSRTGEESLGRLSELWTGLHGRNPRGAAFTEGLAAVLGQVSRLQGQEGRSAEADLASKVAVQAALLEGNRLDPLRAEAAQRAVGSLLQDVGPTPAGRTALRRLHPMLLQGQADPGAPFLLVDDPEILPVGPTGAGRVDRARWKAGVATKDRWRPTPDEVLTVFLPDLGMEAKEFLPGHYAVDSQDRPTLGTLVRWNHFRELSGSQILHCSFQPFFLRRYALHIADRWEAEQGRRPAVHAFTQVSLNGRPHAPLVDPKADLVRVPLSLFGHNAWIRDLPPGRIPESAWTRGNIP